MCVSLIATILTATSPGATRARTVKIAHPARRSYISDLIAVTLLAWVHLNVLVLLQAVYGVPLEKGLVISLPGYVLSLILIGLLFAQRWRASYNTLAREVASLS